MIITVPMAPMCSPIIGAKRTITLITTIQHRGTQTHIPASREPEILTIAGIHTETHTAMGIRITMEAHTIIEAIAQARPADISAMAECRFWAMTADGGRAATHRLTNK